MTAAPHWLVGYDRQTELKKFELPIPEGAFSEVSNFVRFDVDDPEAIGCYELTGTQARWIANLVCGESGLPVGLNFFLEAYDPQTAQGKSRKNKTRRSRQILFRPGRHIPEINQEIFFKVISQTDPRPLLDRGTKKEQCSLYVLDQGDWQC